MPAIQRFASSMLFLCCLAILAMAADDKKTTTIIARPSVFDSQVYDPFVSAISPDGKYVAYHQTPTKGPRTMHLCDTITKKALHALPVMGVLGAAFTPDSSRFVVLCVRQNVKPLAGLPAYQVEVYDVKSGKQLRVIVLKAGQPGGGGNMNGSLPPSISNDLLVVAGRNEVATVYELKTGKVLGDLPGKHKVKSMALSRDGRWLITSEVKPEIKPGEPRGTVHTMVMHTWDVKARKYDRLLYEHSSDVFQVAISNDGRWCAVATRLRVKVFDRTTGEEKTESGTGLATAYTIAFSPDGKRITAANGPRMHSANQIDWGLRFWDWQTENPPTSVVSPFTPKIKKAWQNKGQFHADLMSDDGTRFFSASGNGRLLLDLKNPTPPPDWEPDEEPEPKKGPPKKP